MVRLLLIIAIAATAWFFFRRLAGPQSPPASTPPPTPTGQDIITRCAECGVHVPENNGVRYQTLFFCCPEHLTEHLRKRGQ